MPKLQSHGLRANISPMIRKDTLEGRTHLVCPVILIKEGVANGVMYPASQLSQYPESWNGRPLVAPNHPTVGGRPVTANSKAVREHMTVGTLLNVKYNQQQARLEGEAWIDEKNCRERCPRVMEKLDKNEGMDVSTGLFTDDDMVAAGAQFKNKTYKVLARNYRPDHLALLPDAKGACSWEDGAGMPRLNMEQGEELDGVIMKKNTLHTNPDWVADHDIWEKAKAAASKSNDESDEGFYAIVTSIYKKMGGTVSASTKTNVVYKPEYDEAKDTMVCPDDGSELNDEGECPTCGKKYEMRGDEENDNADDPTAMRSNRSNADDICDECGRKLVDGECPACDNEDGKNGVEDEDEAMKDNAVVGMLKALCTKLGIKANFNPNHDERGRFAVGTAISTKDVKGGKLPGQRFASPDDAPGGQEYKLGRLSDKANEASDFAHRAEKYNKSDASALHEKAAAIHTKAADAWRSQGWKKQAIAHDAMAALHTKAAMRPKGNESYDPETSWSPRDNAAADGTQGWFKRADGFKPADAKAGTIVARTGGEDVLNPGVRIKKDPRGKASYDADTSCEDNGPQDSKNTKNAFPLKGDSTKQTPLPSKDGHAQTDEDEEGGEHDPGEYDNDSSEKGAQEEAVRKVSQMKRKLSNAFPLKGDNAVRGNSFPNKNYGPNGQFASDPTYRAKKASDQAHEIGTRVAHEVAMGVHTEARNYHAKMADKTVQSGAADTERQKHIDAMIEHGRMEAHHKMQAGYAEDQANRAGKQAGPANPHEMRRIDLMSGQETKWTTPEAGATDPKETIDSEQAGMNDKRQGGQLDGDEEQGAYPTEENATTIDKKGEGNIPGTEAQDDTEKPVEVGMAGPKSTQGTVGKDKFRSRDSIK